MVAIVSGNSLGLSLTSLATLGQRGTLGTASHGRNGEAAFVNVANGNLVLQDRDEVLVGRGSDAALIRTYNSQGLLTDDNADNWSHGIYLQQLRLTGTRNTAGSTLTRTDRDGAQAVYSYNTSTGQYSSTAGSGAFDVISFDATTSQYVWTDGDSGVQERYDSASTGRLLSMRDTSGNTLEYSYDAGGRLVSMRTASNETTYIDYSGNNITQVRTVKTFPPSTTTQTLTRTRYAYDASNRLSTVTVDLSPGDNSVANGQTYTTTYTYDGTSTRVASITQKDGTSLSFTYLAGRVATIVNALGESTSFSYDTAARRTTVTDPLGLRTLYDYDTTGQLIRVTSPAVNGVSQTNSFTYNANGDITQSIDGEGRAVVMEYDTRGNQTLQRDSAGNTVTRTYDARNQLLTETVSTVSVFTPSSGVTVNGTSATKTEGASGTWDSGFRSEAGYVGGAAVSFIPAQADKQLMVGLNSDPTLNNSYTSIDYALFCTDGGQLQAYQNGAFVQNLGAYAAGDTLSVAYDGTNVRYLRNGAVLRTVAAAIASLLYADSSFNSAGGTVNNLQFGDTRYVSSNGVSAIGDTATKTSTTNGWNAGFRSKTGLSGPAFVSFTPTQVNKALMVGLNRDPSTDDSYASIDYAFYCTNGGQLEAYESGAFAQGLGAYAAGDTLAVVYDGANVRYMKNGVVLRTVAAPLTQPLFVDASFHDAGARITNLQSDGIAPSTARYVYDAGAKNLLRFSISAEGRVVEHRYNGFGQRTSTIQYAAGVYDLRSLSATAAPTEAQMTTWATGQDRRRTMRTDMVYDFRGQLQRQTIYTSVDDQGNGVTTGYGNSVVIHTYDQAGLLLWTTSADGETQSFQYDGLGRLTSQSADYSGSYTTYDDVGNRVVNTDSWTGLRTTSVYDRAGRLASVQKNEQNNANLGVTRYTYDADGRLRMTQDPTGVRNWMLYDDAGRKVADIDADGSLTEYVYNRSNQVTRAIRYHWQVNPSSLVNGAGVLTNATLESIRTPIVNSGKSTSWNLYDAAGRLAKTVDAAGYVTETRYDSASRVSAIVRYANSVTNTAAITNTTLPTDALVTPSLNASEDRITRYFHDGDGRLVGTLDAEGFLTETLYDAAGRQISTHAYGLETVSDRRSTGTLAQLRAGRSSSWDIYTWTFYDAQGRVAGAVDGEGYLTTFERSTYADTLDGLHETTATRFATKARVAPSAITVNTRLQDLIPLVWSPLDQVSGTIFDSLNRVVVEYDHEGTATNFQYDGDNRNAVFSWRGEFALAPYFGSDWQELMHHPASRSREYRYDSQRRLTHELSAEGSLALQTLYNSASITEQQVENIWINYGIKHAYDLAGRRTSTTDALGHKTLFYYNDDNQLVFTINALGEVTESTYDGLNQLNQTIQYSNRLPAITLATLTGGLVTSSNVRNDVAAIANYDKDTFVTRGYDDRGLLTWIDGSIDAPASTEYRYNAFGEVKESVSENKIYGDDYSDYSNGAPWRIRREVNMYDRRGLLNYIERYDAGAEYSELGTYLGGSSRSYDGFGRLTYEFDDNGRGHSFTYDKLGRLTRKANGLWGTTTSYDAFNRIDTQTNANTFVTRYTYDDAERSTTITTPEGISFSTVRTRHGQTASVRDGNNQTTTYTYDRDGNLTQTNAPLNNVTRNIYDRANRLIETVDARQTRVLYTYDAANRQLSRQVDPGDLNQVTNYRYDAKGQAIWVQDPNGVWTQTEYDSQGRTKAVTVDPRRGPNWVSGADDNPLGLALRTSYVYDGREVISVTDPKLLVTRYTYDALGRRIAEQVDPAALNITRRFVYDLSGNMVASIENDNSVKRFVYNDQNRLEYTIDALGNTERIEYDPEGRVARTTRYATPIVQTTLADPRLPGYWPEAGWQIQQLLQTDAAHDQVQTSTYDRDGRLHFTVDGSGAVVRLSYDGAGNVIENTRYNTRFVGAINEDNLIAFSANVANQLPTDRITRFAYDQLSRLTFTVDANGGVTRLRYDNAGNVIERAAYESTYSGVVNDSNLSTAYANAGNPSSNDRVTRYAYDRSGRLTYTVDASGGVTRQRYDDAGRVLEQIQFGRRYSGSVSDADLTTFYANSGNLTNFDRSTRFVYDKAGRARFTINALGGVVETVYDKNGNVARSIAWEAIVTPSSVTDSSTDVNVRALLPTSTLGARETLYTYDAAGRSVHTAQAKRTSGATKYFTITELQYNGLGKVAKTIAYNAEFALQDLPLEAPLLQVAGRVTAAVDASKDRSVQYFYDLAGRVERTLDGQNYSERFEYDGVGNKTRYTNKNGAVFDYAYDNLGRLVSELSHRVSVTTLDANLNPQTTDNVRIETRMTYTTFGDLATRTEAVGWAGQQRTTTYGYDRLGHQTSTTFEAVDIYNPSADNLSTNGLYGSTLQRYETNLAANTQTAYDVFGQAVVNRDAGGYYSYKTYDKLGRVVNEVDARHYVTNHSYSEVVGESQAFKRLEAQATFTDGLSTSARTVNDAVTAIANTGTPRNVLTIFDKLGRERTKFDKFSGPGITGGAYSVDSSYTNSVVGGQWPGETSYAYNVWGDVESRSSLINRTGNQSAVTRYGYDLKGALTRQVDPAGYVTDHTKNSFGEDTQVTEYATPIAPGNMWATPTTLRASASNLVSDIGFDRAVSYSYDLRGIKTQETQLYVVTGTRNTAATVQLQQVVSHVVTNIVSDGVGNSKTTSKLVYSADWAQSTAGEVSHTYHDAMGRVTATMDGTGRATSYKLNAHGGAVQTTRHASLGTYSGSANPVLVFDSINDQITTQVFDQLGRVKQLRDATNASKFFSYDSRGNLVKQWVPFKDFGNPNQRNAVQAFDYDAVGQQTGTRTLMQRGYAQPAIVSSDTAVYNAFGEITSKLRDNELGVNVEYAFYDYDVGGRVWRTNGDDGVTKVHLYDLQGNVVSTITSPTIDLRAAAYSNPSLVPTTLAGNVRRTINRYDQRNLLVEQFNLGTSHEGGAATTRLHVQQAHDAWGNVLSHTSTLGYLTTYRYNSNNQVIAELKPTTTYAFGTVWRPAGTFQYRPTTAVFYDAWGRNIGTIDANGRPTQATYLVTGELEYEYRPDDGVIRHYYDNFGRETRRDTANFNADPSGFAGGLSNGKRYRYYYDKANRKTNETVEGRFLNHSNGASEAFNSFSYVVTTWSLGSYTYDELGNRTSETSGEDDKQSNLQTLYWYDTAGRLVSSQAPIDYKWWYYNNAGQKVRESGQISNETRFEYDAQGRMSGKIDLGGARTDYTYNRTGELVHQGGVLGRGQDIAYTYYEDGRLRTITDGWNDSRTTYDYDAEGNKVLDRFETNVISGTPSNPRSVHRDVRMSYDELGRMTYATDTYRGAGTPAAYALNFTYDQNGNRLSVSGTYGDDDFRDTRRTLDHVVVPANTTHSDIDGLPTRKVDISYTYDSVNQLLSTYSLTYTGNAWAPTETYLSEHMTYDLEGLRTTHEKEVVNNNTTGALRSRKVEYEYDYANRVTESFVKSYRINQTTSPARFAHRKNIYSYTGWMQEWQWAKDSAKDSFSYEDTAPDRVLVNHSNYNPRGQVTELIGTIKAVGGTVWDDTSRQVSIYDTASNLSSMHVWSYQINSVTPTATNLTSNGSDLTYAYTYLVMDGYRQRTATVTGSTWNGSNWIALIANTTTSDYDVNGQLLQTYDTNNSNTNAEQYLVTDNTGHIVRKLLGRKSTNLNAHTYSAIWTPGGPGSMTPSSATANAARPAAVNLPITPIGSVQSSASGSQQRVLFADDKQIGMLFEKSSQAYSQQWVNSETIRIDTTSSYDVSVNFDEAFGASPVQVTEGSGFVYSINAGDTLRALAQTFYGDGNLWYVIGAANALPDDQPLVAGQQIRIPSVTRSSNTADTFKVYEPGKIIGSTNPDPVAPPPPPPPSTGGGCGTIGMILVVIVAVVVTIYTAGAATAALGPVLAGAVGGAAGSIASQLVGMSIGMQTEFSWKQVGLGAVGGAVTAGLNEVNAFQGLAQISADAAVAARAVTSSVLTQGISVATGLQEEFNWRAVAVSAIAAPLAARVGNMVVKDTGLASLLGGNSSVGTRLATGLVGGVITQRVRMAVYNEGKLDYASIAADAFGNALGESIGEAIKPTGAVFSWDDVDMDAGPHAAAAARLQAAKTAPGTNYTGGQDFDAYVKARRLSPEDQARQNFNEAVAKVDVQRDAQDAVDARAALAAQHARAEAYGKDLQARAADDATNANEMARLMNRSRGQLFANESGSGSDYGLTRRAAESTASSPRDVRRTVDAAMQIAYGQDLTREQLQGALGDVRSAYKNASPDERLWLNSAALSLHEAGATRRFMTPDETVNSPEFAGIAIASNAFGGSNGAAPKSVLPDAGYAGPSFRSAFRANPPPNSIDDLRARYPSSDADVGDFTDMSRLPVKEIIGRVPPGAVRENWTPQPGGAEVGVKFKWTDENGVTNRLRIHDVDPSAPSGSNASEGWVARYAVGKRYYDPVAGKFSHPNSHVEASPFYNPAAANNTHIPVQAPPNWLVNLMKSP